MLWLSSSEVRHQQGSVVLEEGLFDFSLGLLVSVFLVEGDDGSADGESDSVKLGDVSSSVDSDSDVKIGEFLFSENHEWLYDLHFESGGLDEVKGLSVDSDGSVSGGAGGDGDGGLFLSESLDCVFHLHIFRFINLHFYFIFDL